ncbi:MAG: hypothetical protein WBX18_00955, partial [Terracidiphilus sp.]
MRFRWPVFLASLCAFTTSCAPQWQRTYEMQPAPDFLFDQRPFHIGCADRPAQLPPGTHAWFSTSSQARYARTRLDFLNLPLKEVPALTIAAELVNWVHIEGADQDHWALEYCAMGEGNTEEEARGSLQPVSMSRMGGLVTLNETYSKGHSGGHGDLFLDAPKDAPLTVHAIEAVEVRNMSGPVRVTGTGGRVTILNTTGKVEADGKIVDFAGSEGHVMLTSDSEIDIKLTATQFQGGLSAYAQREVRVRVPRGFESPLEVWVSRRRDFVCRADFCSRFKQERNVAMFVYKYPGNG